MKHLEGPRYTVSDVDGERALRSVLGDDEPKECTTFPFLRLPAELRNTVYEMMFQYPETGILFYTRQPDARVMRRPYQGDFDFKKWETARHLTTDNTRDILSPLLVKRQLYRGGNARLLYHQPLPLYVFVAHADYPPDNPANGPEAYSGGLFHVRYVAVE